MTVIEARRPAPEVAATNLEYNTALLGEWVDSLPACDVEWVWGRDGALTCKTDGRWWLGNSLPRRTAERMLRDLKIAQNVCCFLDVPHGNFLKLALGKLKASQAVIAVVPDLSRLNVLLHSENFSEELIAQRLYFATGDNWECELAEIFRTRPGLPTPSAFVRTAFTEEPVLQEMIGKAQAIFAAENSRRKETIEECVRKPRRESQSGSEKKICLIAPSGFRLWDPAADLLVKMFKGKQFDTDQPTSSSPLGLALAACECDAVVAANIGRADAAGIVSNDIPWIDWITRPALPAYVGVKRDHLFLTDPSWRQLARQAGWPEEQIGIAGWPSIFSPHEPGKYLAIIADTMNVEIEPDHFDMSSHSLLWETIRKRLIENPFEMRQEPAHYLLDWIKRCNVGTDGLDTAAFVERLIIPAYQQSVARGLIRSGFPVRLFGNGWDELDEFGAYAAGPIADMTDLQDAVGNAAALVHTWPVRYAHPIDAMGRPVISMAGSNELSLISEAKKAIRGELTSPNLATPLAAEMVYARI